MASSFFIHHRTCLEPVLIYPIKTVLVAACLIYFWDVYKEEIKWSFNGLAVQGFCLFDIGAP